MNWEPTPAVSNHGQDERRGGPARVRVGALPPEAGPRVGASEEIPSYQVPDELRQMVMALLELPPEKEQLLNKQLFIVLTFERWLFALQKAGPSERSRSKANLGALARSADDVLQLVRSLDDPSSDLLSNAMSQPTAEDETPSASFHMFEHALVRVVNTSRQGAKAKLKTGKAPNPALDNLTFQLAWIYQELTGKKPKHLEKLEAVDDPRTFRERKVPHSLFGRFVKLVVPYVDEAITDANLNAALARALWTGRRAGAT